jgi:hypothetical protein
MRYLARRKLGIAEKIGSRALRADAMEAIACGWLSFVVVITLTLQWFVCASWIDSVTIAIGTVSADAPHMLFAGLADPPARFGC